MRRRADEVVALLSHELRNPLAPILSTVQLLRMEAGGESRPEYLIIERQARRLARVVDDLLSSAQSSRTGTRAGAGGTRKLSALVRTPAAPTPRRGGRAERILLVDDNRDIADTLSAILRRRGHAVQVSYDGSSALAVAETFAPTQALLDVGLPDFDGFQLARRLRGVHGLSRLRMTAVTGYSQPEDRRRAKAAGFAALVAKPVDVDQLIRLVERPPTVPGPRRALRRRSDA